MFHIDSIVSIFSRISIDVWIISLMWVCSAAIIVKWTSFIHLSIQAFQHEGQHSVKGYPKKRWIQRLMPVDTLNLLSMFNSGPKPLCVLTSVATEINKMFWCWTRHNGGGIWFTAVTSSTVDWIPFVALRNEYSNCHKEKLTFSLISTEAPLNTLK